MSDSSTNNTTVPRERGGFSYSTAEEVKNFWLKWGSHYMTTIRKDIYKDQQDLLIKTLQEECDMSKVETVLDVGCGYGRIAKLMLDNFPAIRSYDGIDISKDQLKNAREFVGMDYSSKFHTHEADFETTEWQWKYDMVVCVETMTVLPYDIRYWIDQLVSLSKKYVVSLDWHSTTPNPPAPISQINTWHDYPKIYTSNPKVISTKLIEIPRYTEFIFVSRVK